MLKKFLLFCFVIMAFGIVPSLAETIGPVQPSTVFTVDFKLPDDLRGAIFLDMSLDYPHDTFMLLPTESIQEDRWIEYSSNLHKTIQSGITYSPCFAVLPDAADGTYSINLTIDQALDQSQQEIEGLTIPPMCGENRAPAQPNTNAYTNIDSHSRAHTNADS